MWWTHTQRQHLHFLGSFRSQRGHSSQRFQAKKSKKLKSDPFTTKKQEICQFVFQGRPSLCLKYSFENVLIFIFLRRQFFFGKEKVYRRYIYMQCKMFVWNLIMQFCISHSTYTPAVTLKFQFVLYISDCIWTKMPMQC